MISGSQRPSAVAKKLTLTTVLTLEGHKGSIPSISYFLGGKIIISGSDDKTIRAWDLEAGKEIKEARDVCEQKVCAVGVSRDGRWAVTGGGDGFTGGELRLCEIETGIVRTYEGHSQRITSIDISGDSTLLASGAEDFTVRIWNLETGKPVAGPFKSADWVGAVRFSRDSKKLAVKSWWGNYLEVWDVETQKLDVRVGTFGVASFSSTPVFWTTNDKTIVTAFSLRHHDTTRTIYEFDVSTLQTVGAPFEGHTKIITGLALSLDCALLASASADKTIKLWAFESRQLLASFDLLSTAPHLILSPDSRQLVYTTRHNNNIYLCNILPEILASIPVPQVRTSAPRNLLLADFGTLSLIANQFSASEAPLNAQQGLPFHSLPRPPFSFAHRRAGPDSWTERHAGTSRIQPTDMRPLTDMRQWPTLLPPPHMPSSTVGLQLPQLRSDSRELLPSSSHRDVEADNLPLGVTLRDLSKYITKDGDYPVARGGFGEIWKCTFHMDRRSVKVAVKALQVYAADQLGAAKTKKIKASPSTKGCRIKHELKICAKLKHANILPVYGYTYGFGPFLAIVSPWAENGSLSDYLEVEGAALTLVRRFRILRDIIAGLQYLHANSVIHGDFNGPNVLIHGDGTACVADFGLSLMYSEIISASKASWTSSLKGNMRWMAPELLAEQEDETPARPSEQSDIFSFGGIMLQVLTNQVPYYHLSNDAAIILCIAKSQTPPRSRYSELPERYWEFIEQCWSTDPRERPSTEGADTAIRNEFYSLSSSS
ncbi:kinase-like domain-containing protein [Suillus americanus]|nr:kinase-like domain-containing protein [Suillus americanus]